MKTYILHTIRLAAEEVIFKAKLNQKRPRRDSTSSPIHHGASAGPTQRMKQRGHLGVTKDGQDL